VLFFFFFFATGCLHISTLLVLERIQCLKNVTATATELPFASFVSR